MVNPLALAVDSVGAEMGEHPLVSGLRWILANTHDPDGARWTQRSFARAAGMSSESHVGQILRGTIAAESVQIDTLQKIAAAGGVSVSWLQTGGGPPQNATSTAVTHERFVVEDDDYPSRPEALELMRGKVDESILRALKARRLDNRKDPGLDYWMSEALKLKRKALEFEAEYNEIGGERATAREPNLDLAPKKRGK